MSRSLIAVLGLAWMGASPAFAQDVEITVFDELVPTTRTETPSVRAARLEAEVLEQPEAYELRWLLAEAYLRVAADIPERDTKRDLGYQAREQAAAAATLRPDGVEGHYWLSVAAGLVADNVGGRTKIRMGDQSWNESTWVLATDSLHAGAHHVQGRIHAGVMRLNAFTRFIGRILLGGDVLGEASWEGAEYHLRRAA